MAAAPKKKKTSQPAKKNTRTPPPPAPTYGREIAGGVCLLLALCAVVSYFQEEALFITFFGGLLKGLLGYGYWLSAPAADGPPAADPPGPPRHPALRMYTAGAGTHRLRPASAAVRPLL